MERIEKLIRAYFDQRPFGITKMLDLLHPNYQRTASYGPFGRVPTDLNYVGADGNKQKAAAFSWEMTDRAEVLRKAAGIKT